MPRSHWAFLAVAPLAGVVFAMASTTDWLAVPLLPFGDAAGADLDAGMAEGISGIDRSGTSSTRYAGCSAATS